MASVLLPHPLTGRPFASPVAPGTGWPGDTADAGTPVATTPDAVARLAATASRAELDAAVTLCRACPRLVGWREDVATTKRAAFADQPYWGRPVASFGDPDATALVVGLAPDAQSTFPISDAVSAVKCTMSQPTAARSASRARPRSNASREEWNSNPSSSTPTFSSKNAASM